MLIVCDLDGTVAKITHRVHYVRTNPRNYEAFSAAIPLDTPEKEVIGVINALHSAGHKVVFASGRGEQDREVTLNWMVEHIGEWVLNTNLYMRKKKDYRSDEIIKTEILSQIESELGSKPDIAIDDRLNVCRMWHSHGIKLLRVGNPDLDNNFNVRSEQNKEIK